MDNKCGSLSVEASLSVSKGGLILHVSVTCIYIETISFCINNFFEACYLCCSIQLYSNPQSSPHHLAGTGNNAVNRRLFHIKLKHCIKSQNQMVLGLTFYYIIANSSVPEKNQHYNANTYLKRKKHTKNVLKNVNES